MPGSARKMPSPAQIAKVIAFALEAAGAPIVKGGARNAARGLRGADQGARRRDPHRRRRRLDRPVQTAARAACGWRRAKTISAGKSVICSVTPTQLYERLLGGDAAGRAMPRRCRNYRYGKGNFQIHYALDKPPAWRGEGLGQGRAAASDARPRRRVEGRATRRARHAAGNADDLRRPAACARSVALPAGQGDPVAAAARSAAPHQGRCGGQDRRAGRRQMDRGAARSLCRSRRGDPRQPYRRLHATTSSRGAPIRRPISRR